MVGIDRIKIGVEKEGVKYSGEILELIHDGEVRIRTGMLYGVFWMTLEFNPCKLLYKTNTRRITKVEEFRKALTALREYLKSKIGFEIDLSKAFLKKIELNKDLKLNCDGLHFFNSELMGDILLNQFCNGWAKSGNVIYSDCIRGQAPIEYYKKKRRNGDLNKSEYDYRSIYESKLAVFKYQISASSLGKNKRLLIYNKTYESTENKEVFLEKGNILRMEFQVKWPVLKERIGKKYLDEYLEEFEEFNSDYWEELIQEVGMTKEKLEKIKRQRLYLIKNQIKRIARQYDKNRISRLLIFRCALKGNSFWSKEELLKSCDELGGSKQAKYQRRKLALKEVKKCSWFMEKLELLEWFIESIQ